MQTDLIEARFFLLQGMGQNMDKIFTLETDFLV